MNKKVLLLIFLIMLLITAIVYNLYKSSEKNLKEALTYYEKFDKKAKEIISLKNKYSTKPIKIIKRYCKTQNTKLLCKIPKNKLYKLSSFLKSNIKIKSFNIKDDNKSVIFSAEIIK